MKQPGDYSIGSEVWPGLAKLVEEMGELQQELAKLVAKGGEDGEHWDGRGKLRERIQDEMADVSAAIRFFGETNGLSGEAMITRAKAKLRQFQKWHEEQGSN